MFFRCLNKDGPAGPVVLLQQTQWGDIYCLFTYLNYFGTESTSTDVVRAAVHTFINLGVSNRGSVYIRSSFTLDVQTQKLQEYIPVAIKDKFCCENYTLRVITKEIHSIVINQ